MRANVPYFPGAGGVTPPGGNTGAPGSVVDGWARTLRSSENRINVALLGGCRRQAEAVATRPPCLRLGSKIASHLCRRRSSWTSGANFGAPDSPVACHWTTSPAHQDQSLRAAFAGKQRVSQRAWRPVYARLPPRLRQPSVWTRNRWSPPIARTFDPPVAAVPEADSSVGNSRHSDPHWTVEESDASSRHSEILQFAVILVVAFVYLASLRHPKTMPDLTVEAAKPASTSSGRRNAPRSHSQSGRRAPRQVKPLASRSTATASAGST